jgi:phosphoribosylanthranilate isomerase
MKVKLCGQTRAEDIRFSFESGAALCGVVVEVPSSPRSMSIDSAQPLFDEFGKKLVALTANAEFGFYETLAARLKPAAIQLTADETAEEVKRIKDATGLEVFKSLHLPKEGSGDRPREDFVREMERYVEAGVSVFILDTRVPNMYGGSGVKSDWTLARGIIESAPAETFLAGGISQDNVLEAAALNPDGIDLASGVEMAPGIKSKEKIKSLFKALETVKH